MMDEWKLTPEQVLDVVKQSGIRCSVDTIEHKCKGTMTDYCTYAAEDAARAAQRRVVEAYESMLCESLDCQYTSYDQAHCVACKAVAFMQSLKAALGVE